MTQKRDTTTTQQDRSSQIFHPRFAAFYEWYARLGTERRLTDPLRQETAGQASGVVLEVGAGTGLNFPVYHPERVERVEGPALRKEPDSRKVDKCGTVAKTSCSINVLMSARLTWIRWRDKIAIS
jgi:hypothetical protein